MAQELANIAIKLSADMVDFENDMGRASRLAKKKSGQMRKSFNQAFKAISVAALAAGGALATLVKHTANTADNVQKLSLRLGVSTEFLSEMRHVASLTGVSFERVDVGIRKMSKSINDGVNGLSTSTRAFKALGISLEDLQKLSPEEQFTLIADKLSKVETQSVKTGAAMDIFGRAGVDMLSLFEEGAEGINAMRKEAKLFGFSISQEAADGAAHFNDELTRLSTRASGFAQALGLSLLPALTEIIDQFNGDGVTKADNDFQGLQTTIGNVYGALLFLVGGYQVIGEAVAVMVTKSLMAFDVVKNSLENFVNQFKRSALIISSIWDDTANAEDSKLAAEMAAISAETDKLIASLNSKALDDDFLAKASEIWDGAAKKMDAVKNAHKSAAKQIKSDGKKIKDGAAAVEALGEAAILTEAEFGKLESSYNSILESMLSPLEQLELKYDQQVKKIHDWQDANEDNLLILGEGNLLISDLTDKLDENKLAIEKNKKAIEEQLTPYEELIQEMENELRMLGLKGPALQRALAEQYLMSQGVNTAALSQEELNKKVEDYLALLDKITSKQKEVGNTSPFAQMLENFEGAFGAIIANIGGSLADTIGSMSNAFMQMSGEGGDNSAAAQVAGVAFAGINGFLSAREAGIDDAGSVLRGVQSALALIPGWGQAIAAISEVVNQLTGGKLFGTAFEATGSTRNLGIDSAGGFGGIESRSSRQRSLFRGTQRRTTETDLDASTLATLDALFESLQIAIQNSAIAVGGVAGDIIAGSFAEEFDKDGNLTSQISTVLGRTFEESFAEFQQRLVAENIFAGIGTVFDEVGDIAERWRDDAGTLLEGAQLLLLASSDIANDDGLFESLETVANVIEDMTKFGETLAQTYSRVKASVNLLDDALEVIGISFDMARVDYVNLAADIAEAAGGLPAAANLWSSYFDSFYSEQELFAQRLSSATEIRDASLEGLGLDSDISTNEFRALFEEALPNLSAEAIVEWLRAADAIGAVVDMQAVLNAENEEAARILEAEAAALSDFINGIASELEDLDLSDFAKTMKDIRKAFNDQIKTAKELGATERELAMIQRFATRQIQNAIAALEADLAGAITDLYGTGLESIEAQIAALQQQATLGDQIAQANFQRYQAELAAIQNIMGFVDSLFLSPTLSTLNPAEQLAEAQAQFDELFALAQGGDVDAINALPGLVNTLLGLGRDNFASGEQFTTLFDTITAQLSSLGIGVGSVSEPPASVADPRLLDLLRQQTLLQEEIANGERGEAVLALANQIRELAGVTEESFSSLAERLGLPIEQFLADLGIDLENLTDETAIALADVAQLLGVELGELAESVGISLGDLADANSLLNNALEATIAGLPEESADALEQLLTNVEEAADGTEQERALNELEAFADALPEDQRDALAPFFDKIDPTSDAQRQLDAMARIDSNGIELKNSMVAVKTAIELEGGQTQSRMDSLNNGFDDLARAIRDFLSQQAA